MTCKHDWYFYENMNALKCTRCGKTTTPEASEADKTEVPHAFPNPHRTDLTGMTLRQYAAIKLKAPNSGTDWLDDMICQSLKDDFAVMAMAIMWDAYDKGYCGMEDSDDPNIKMVSEGAYQLADAMMKAREA